MAIYKEVLDIALDRPICDHCGKEIPAKELGIEWHIEYEIFGISGRNIISKVLFFHCSQGCQNLHNGGIRYAEAHNDGAFKEGWLDKNTPIDLLEHLSGYIRQVQN